MKFSLFRNKTGRKSFHLSEIPHKVNKFLFTFFLRNNSFQDKSYLRFIMTSMSRNSFKSRVIKRCVLTGRNKSVDTRWGLSRIVFRDMIKSGLIPGYKKAVW
jgi:ribosomal protein S14